MPCLVISDYNHLTDELFRPIIGGAFADSPATWRWSFYINLVVAAVFAPVYVFMIPSVDPQPGRPLADRAIKFDFSMFSRITENYSEAHIPQLVLFSSWALLAAASPVYPWVDHLMLGKSDV